MWHNNVNECVFSQHISTVKTKTIQSFSVYSNLAYVLKSFTFFRFNSLLLWPFHTFLGSFLTVKVNCLSHYLVPLSHTRTSCHQCWLVGSRFLPVHCSKLLTHRGHWSTVLPGLYYLLASPGSSAFSRVVSPHPIDPQPPAQIRIRNW